MVLFSRSRPQPLASEPAAAITSYGLVPYTPKVNNTITRDIENFKTRLSAIEPLSRGFVRYLNVVFKKRGWSETDNHEFYNEISHAGKLSNTFWALCRDLVDYIQNLYLDGKQFVPALVLGYNAKKVVIQCPFCEGCHEHQRVIVDPGRHMPTIYPSACGANGGYRVVFPGDIDKLTGGTGEDAIGIQVHPSGSYWQTVMKDAPSVEEFFEVKYRRRRQSLPHALAAARPFTLAPTDDDVFDMFQKMNILESDSYTHVPVTAGSNRHYIRTLEVIANSAIACLNTLDRLVGFYSPSKGYMITAERFKEWTQKDTRSGKFVVERDRVICSFSKKKGHKKTLANVESDGFRTICSCIRGPQYEVVSTVSGRIEAERVEPESLEPFNNAQLLRLVKELAVEIGHVFPGDIPDNAGYWKSELERTNKTATGTSDWYACHAEKKMLVRYLIMHTTWRPLGFSHPIFDKKKEFLGPEAGVRTGGCLTKDMKFFTSYEICDDCEAFISRVRDNPRFGSPYLTFERMVEAGGI